jgi:hypothetical protein
MRFCEDVHSQVGPDLEEHLDKAISSHVRRGVEAKTPPSPSAI